VAVRRAAGPTVSEVVEQAKGAVNALLPAAKPRYLSTGCTVLNLAMTDSIDGGWVLGTTNLLPGDSSAGKTLLLLTTFAEVHRNPAFDKYALYYDQPELREQFKDRFGGVMSRLDRSMTSHTVEEWEAHCWKAVKLGKPFIYGTDSFDSVGSETERGRLDDLVKKMDAGKNIAMDGSYGMDKQKQSGQLLREITASVSGTDSLHITLFQTRDKIDAMAFGKKKTRSGGHAFKFYGNHEIWLSLLKEITRKDKQVGGRVKATMEKNNTTGKFRDVVFCVYNDYGVDDVGSMVDWMCIEGFWKAVGVEKPAVNIKENTVINAGDDFPKGPRDELIKHIEGNNLKQSLRELVQECWNEVEKEIATDRAPKYEWREWKK